MSNIREALPGDAGLLSLPIVAVMSDDADLTERLVAALAGVATVIRADPSSDAGLSVVEATRPALVAVDAQCFGNLLPDQVTRLRAILPNGLIVALGDEQDADQVLAAVRAGAQDLVDRSMSELGLRRALRPRMERLPRGPQADRQAPCFALLAARCEDRSREVALAIATARAKQGKSVLLLDLTAGAPVLAMGLDMTARYGVGEALRDLDRLDGALLQSAVPRDQATGLSVLLLGSAEDLAEAGPGDLRALVVLLRSLYAEIVLHLGDVSPQAPLLPLAAGLRRFGLVMTQSVASAAAAAAVLQALDQPGLARRERAVGIIAAHDGAVHLSAARIATELELDAPVLAPAPGAALLNALNAGTLSGFVAGSRPLQKMAAAVAGRLAEQKGATSAEMPRRGLRLALPWKRGQ
jgi:pilus assembly protein CpaE